MEGKQLELFDDVEYDGTLSSEHWRVPFVDEVQEFNDTFGKPNNWRCSTCWLYCRRKWQSNWFK